MTQERQRVRLRLPSGAEFEAEGSAEFVTAERREFAVLHAPAAVPSGAGMPAGRTGEPPWEALAEARGNHLQLRAKAPGHTEKEACLLLLAAARPLLRTPKPTAAQLARWLRASGHPIQRVDRAIQESIRQGEILASGSRRARRYELSTPGLAKAFGLAFQMAAFLGQPARL